MGEFDDLIPERKPRHPGKRERATEFDDLVPVAGAPADNTASLGDYQPLPDLMPEYDDAGNVLRATPFAPLGSVVQSGPSADAMDEVADLIGVPRRGRRGNTYLEAALKNIPRLGELVAQAMRATTLIPEAALNTAERFGVPADNLGLSIQRDVIDAIGTPADEMNRLMRGLDSVGYGQGKAQIKDAKEALNPWANDNRAKAAEAFGAGENYQELTLGARARTLGDFIAHGTLNSAADMAGAVFAPAPYVAAYTDQTARSRAANDGRPLGFSDITIGAGNALVQTVAEKFATGRLFPGGVKPAMDGAAAALGRVARETGIQGGTEYVQEAIDYLSTQLGTKKGATLAGTNDAGLSGLLIGSPLGTVAQGAKEVARGVSGLRVKRPISAIDELPDNAIDPAVLAAQSAAPPTSKEETLGAQARALGDAALGSAAPPPVDVVGGTQATLGDIANDAAVVEAFRNRPPADPAMDEIDALLARNLPPAAPASTTPSSEGAGVAATPEIGSLAAALGLEPADGQANPLEAGRLDVPVQPEPVAATAPVQGDAAGAPAQGVSDSRPWRAYRGGRRVESYSTENIRSDAKNSIDNGYGIYITSDTATADHYGSMSENGARHDLEISAPRHSLLDRDKPLSEQSPQIIAGLQAAGLYEGNESILGSQLYDRLVNDNKKGGGLSLARGSNADAMKAANAQLQAAGIRGLSYQARHIPGVTNTAEHYVIFDGADIRNAATPPATVSDDAAGAQAPTVDAPTMQNRDRSRAASVSQMQDIRRNPDPERLGFSRDPNTGAPMVGAGRPIADADKGRADTVVMASGRRVPVQYAVVEADELAASHDADGRANPGYESAPLKALNNGRTAGLQAAYSSGNTDAYRQGIAADAALHGVSAEAIAGKRKPVLVRLYDPAQNTGDMGAESNASAQLGLSPTEQAQTDARSLPDLAGLSWSEDGNLSPSANVEFFRKWFRNIGDAQAATLQDAQGRPNAQALQRVKGALVQRAYGDERLLTALSEDVNPDNRNVMNALVQAAPAFATLDPDSLAGEIRSAVVGGLELLRDASARGLSLRDAIAQGDLLGRNPNADTVAQFMAANARSANRMAEAFKVMAAYADNAQRQAATLDVFGAAPTPSVQGALGAANIEDANDARPITGRIAEGNGSGQPAEVGRAGAGDAFALQPQAAAAPQQTGVSQSGLFTAPTQREQVAAAQQARDVERNGLGRDLVRPEQGDGDLLAGDRPEQTRVEASRDMFVTTRGQREEADRAKREQAEAGNRSPDSDPAATGGLWPDAAPGGLRPDASPSLTRRAKYAVDALVRRFGGSVLADTLARDFREKGSAQLVGQTVQSEADFAALAQVYRNPIFETLHYVFVDARGVVLGETAISDRMPASSIAFPAGIGTKSELTAWIESVAPRGTTGLWMTHNHPSGNPTPSNADLGLTRNINDAFRRHGSGIRLMGHVVLNHGTYGRISPDGTVRPNANIPAAPADPMRAERGIPLADMTITGPADASRVGKLIHNETSNGDVAVIVTNARQKVVLATAIPAKALVGKRGAALLSQLGERSGATRVFLVANQDEVGGPGGATYEGIRALGKRGIVADVIVVARDGSTHGLSAVGHLSGRELGQQSKSRQSRMDRGDRVFDGGVREEAERYTPEQEAALVKAGLQTDRRSSLSRVADNLRERWAAVRDAVKDGDNFKQSTFDKFHGLRMAEAQVGLNDPEQSAYVAARMAAGLGSNMEGLMLYGAPEWDGGVLAIKDGTVGLLDALKPVEGKVDEWLGWMVGRRAKLLKSQGRENNLSDADIAALLSLADGNEAAFQQAARDYLTIKNAVLDLAEQAGVIDPVARAAWDHAEYVPFYRADEGGSIGPGTRKGLAGQTSGIRTLKGGEQALADPLANIVRNFAKLVDASLKNRAVLLAVDGLGATYFSKAPREMQPATIPLDQVKKHLRDAGVPQATIDGMPTGALKGVQRMLSIVPPTGENVVRVMRDGKAEYYEVLDPLVLRSLTAFKQANKSLAIKPFIWFKRLLTTGVTTTAEFVGANFIRDSGSAWVISDDRFIPGWDSLKGIGNTLRNDAGTREMMMAGSTFLGGNFYDGDPDAAAASLRRALRAKGMSNQNIEGMVGTIARTPLHLWDAWLKLSGAVENANRRAVYDAALKAGRTKTEAAYMARDLMDFAMQGDAQWVQFFSDVLPFFNARLQGMYKLGRRAGTPKGRKAMILRGGIIALASAALYAWNVMNHADAWDELEEWDKDAYWHIAPGTDYHVRIPKPFELGLVFGTAPERSMEAVRRATTGEGDTPAATWDSLVRAITGTLAINPIPQAALPIAEQWANKRFFTGRPIENMGDENLLPEARGEWYTSDTMKGLGRMSGLSPKRLEHLWNGYTAGLGGYVLDASDYIVRQATDAPERPDMRLGEMPVLGRFLRAGPGRSKYSTQFYERLREAEQIEQTVKEYTVAGKDAEAKKLEDANRELLGERIPSKRAKAGFLFANVKAMRKVQSELTNLREEMEDVALSRTLSSESKRARLDELETKRNRVVREAVKP